MQSSAIFTTMCQWDLLYDKCITNLLKSTGITRSVAVGFSRHDMPPMASTYRYITGPRRPRLIMWPWLLWSWHLWVIDLHPYTKIKVVGLTVRKIRRHTMCVSINGPGTLFAVYMRDRRMDKATLIALFPTGEDIIMLKTSQHLTKLRKSSISHFLVTRSV